MHKLNASIAEVVEVNGAVSVDVVVDVSVSVAAVIQHIFTVVSRRIT